MRLLTKGTRVLVEGRLVYGEIVDANGNTQNTTSIVASKRSVREYLWVSSAFCERGGGGELHISFFPFSRSWRDISDEVVFLGTRAKGKGDAETDDDHELPKSQESVL